MAAIPPWTADESLLREIITEKFSTMGGRGETYPFRMWETLYLLEAFVGTEVVAKAMVDHCLAALTHTKLWGHAAFDVDHESANFARVVPGLGWLRHRMAPAAWNTLVAPLKKGNPKLPNDSANLRALVGDSSSLEDVMDGAMFAKQRRDKGFLDAQVERWSTNWTDAQMVFVRGSSTLDDCDTTGLCRAPKWEQQRTLAHVGSIRAPGTVRVIGAYLASRSVSDLAKRPGDKALVAAVRSVLGGAAPVAPPSPAQLRKDKTRLVRDLPAQMKACGDDPERERVTMRAAFERYTEINAALGDITPEAYFTHSLDLDWKADEERVRRWIDVAVDVA